MKDPIEEDENIMEQLKNAWMDHVPKSYPGHVPRDHRILMAKDTDAWIVVKVMGLTNESEKIYYTETRHRDRKRTYTVVIGDEALIRAFRKLNKVRV